MSGAAGGGAGWLRQRLPDAPSHLLDVMIEALPASDGPVPAALASGAMTLYRSVASGPGTREAAVFLLAADALFTHAFEAQAEVDPEGIGAFADHWGARNRLGEICR